MIAYDHDSITGSIFDDDLTLVQNELTTSLHIQKNDIADLKRNTSLGGTPKVSSRETNIQPYLENVFNSWQDPNLDHTHQKFKQQKSMPPNKAVRPVANPKFDFLQSMDFGSGQFRPPFVLPKEAEERNTIS